MSEAELIGKLRQWLESGGYAVATNVLGDPSDPALAIPAAASSTVHGTDLVGDDGTTRWVVEAKGDFDATQQYYVNVPCGLAQIASRMRHRWEGLRFGYALPYTRIEQGVSPNAKMALSAFGGCDMWERLEIWLLLVRDDGTVEEVPPSDVCGVVSSM